MNEFGDLLRQSRDFKGVTLREAERATRIRRAYLTALEAGDFDQLPAAAYARGIVRNYAQYLGLDPAATLALYERASGSTSASIAVVAATRPLGSSSHWAPNFAIIAFMLVMSAVVFAWMYSAYFQRPDALATTTIGMPTVTAVPDSILALADDQATVATQGGGVATTTPTPTPTETATPPQEAVVVEAAPTDAVEEPIVEDPVDEAVVDDEPVDEATNEQTAEPIGTGAHTFVIYTSEDVWVQVVLDGETAFDDVLPAGSERIYYADSAAITSGNAALVEVYVDGDAYGALGDSWDATFYYP
jgi:cytoskeleton protein RodZ